MDRIKLKGMTFYAFHGVSKSERELGQQYEIDVELSVDTKKAGNTDNIEDTINYAEVFDRVESIVEKNSFKLLETVAERISNALLKDFEISGIKVVVRKINPPVKGIIDHVEVEIERNKK